MLYSCKDLFIVVFNVMEFYMLIYGVTYSILQFLETVASSSDFHFYIECNKNTHCYGTEKLQR